MTTSADESAVKKIKDMHDGHYKDRFVSFVERVSYLYDGLGFEVLAEGVDITGRNNHGSWHETSDRVFNPTSEYLMTNNAVISRNYISNHGHSFL